MSAYDQETFEQTHARWARERGDSSPATERPQVPLIPHPFVDQLGQRGTCVTCGLSKRGHA